MKAGTIVTCPSDTCGAEQLKTTKDVLPEGQMRDAGFESLGFDLDGATTTKCWKCGTYWYRKHPKTGVSQIHTKEEKWVQLGKVKKYIIIPSPSSNNIH